MRSSGLSSSLIELLESRIAPAGVITLDVDKFGYVLTGDALSNDLLITRDGSQIILTPQNGTQILDKTSGSTPPPSVTTPISLAIFSNRLDINMGPGADVLKLQDLSLLGDLRVDSGATSSTSADADVVEITNLKAGGDVTLNARSGTWTVNGQNFYVGGNAQITSTAQAFDLDVTSLFVGDQLTVTASIAKNTDRFGLRAQAFVAFNDFVITPRISADAPENALSLQAGSVFNVGGSFRVIKDQTDNAAVTLEAGVVDIGGKLSVENQSSDKPLEVSLLADALRIHKGIGISSRSTQPTSVDLQSDLIRIDGSVSAKFSKGDGHLGVVADDLLINGNVSFAAKGASTLRIEGAGDIFGKVSASLGNGSGEVTVSGKDLSQLFFDGLNVTTPAKLPATAGAASITVKDVSVFGKVGLRLGSGADTVNIDNSDFYKLVSISTGNGNDVVNLHTAGTHDASFSGGVRVLLGGGDDTLTLGLPTPPAGQDAPLVTIFQLAVFDGGAGNDSYLANGRNVSFKKVGVDRLPKDFAPRVRNFEPQM